MAGGVLDSASDVLKSKSYRVFRRRCKLALAARTVAGLINIARTFENFLPQLPESSSVGKYIGFVRLSSNYLENRFLRIY